MNLGIQVQNLSPEVRNKLGIREKTGVAVIQVTPGSAADDAGIQAGDVIKEVNHRAVNNLNDYNSAMAKAANGKPVLLLLKRGGRTFYVSINAS
jgi:serine protease Do